MVTTILLVLTILSMLGSIGCAYVVAVDALMLFKLTEEQVRVWNRREKVLFVAAHVFGLLTISSTAVV